MDAAIPLWRTGVHALATDHGCKAKDTGESSLLCNAFVIVLKTGDSAVTGSGSHSEVIVSWRKIPISLKMPPRSFTACRTHTPFPTVRARSTHLLPGDMWDTKVW